ncbi:hypothetical protein EII29_10930 [Leptotrichia sp. OH3620_COT-345]|uniref:hypothetical protein n=1 Tax=Leptotrichia sp. OH3620_COT-345 TaxID=2491048 RepID=UPI000F64ABAA|nr:hypothetical protein [Leptotrichia sp. OH3620_COT-345]RRD37920.1 hypothetical protein EII29_10930 [Leptotrichia sp. OH3620_COT-345]
MGDFSEKFIYKKYDKYSESTYKNRCNNNVDQCMKLYGLTIEKVAEYYGNRKKEAEMVTKIEGFIGGIFTGYLTEGLSVLASGIVGGVVGEGLNYVNNSVPSSDNINILKEIQVKIAISEIERQRKIQADGIYYSESQVLGDIANRAKRQKLTEKDLGIVNSRIIGKKIDMSELNKRVSLYNKYNSKKSEQEKVDIYIIPRKTIPIIRQLNFKSSRP